MLYNEVNLISTLHHLVVIYPVTDLVVNESPVIENALVSVMQWKISLNVINCNVDSYRLLKRIYLEDQIVLRNQNKADPIISS